MSDVSTAPAVLQFEGDEPLYCLLGKHTYIIDRCKYCQRRNTGNTELPTVNN